MCSPARKGSRTLKIAVKNKFNHTNINNAIVINYNADSFTSGCHNKVSKICEPKQINPCLYVNETSKI